MRVGRFGFLLFLAVVVLFGALLVTVGVVVSATKPPEKNVVIAKPGNVTFLHAEHTKRLKGDCKVCHVKLFKEDAKAPLGYKAGLHKPAEKAKTSCAACHVIGGTAFPSAANCKKCHVK